MTPRLTADDEKLLKGIAKEKDTREVAVLIGVYYADADRADRTPRSIMYFHLGVLATLASKNS